MQPPQRSQEARPREGLTIREMAHVRRLLMRAPLRTGLIALTVATAFFAWNLSSEPTYRATTKLRVEDVSQKSPQLEHRAIPTGTIDEGEALTILKSRSLVADVVRSPELDLTTWVTDENAPPLRRMLRGAIASVSSHFKLRAHAEPKGPGAPRSVRVRFISPTAVSISLISAKPGIEWSGDEAERRAYVPGRTIDFHGLALDLTTEGRPDGRVWRIDALNVEEAIDRVLTRVRVDKQQHQPGTLALTVMDDDPRRAAGIARALSEAFIERDLALVRERAAGKIAYLEAELGTRRIKLDRMETERSRILIAHPDAVTAAAARIELAQREGSWDDTFRRVRKSRISVERVEQQIAEGVAQRAAIAGMTAIVPTEIARLLETLGMDEQALRSVERGSKDTGYRRTLLLKADDHTLAAQQFDIRVKDLQAIVAAFEEGDDAALGRLGGDLASEGSIPVNGSIRLWVDELEKSNAKLAALQSVFKDSYEDVGAAKVQVAHYRAEILSGLRTQLEGLTATLQQKQSHASFWRDLFESFPEAESELIRVSIAQIQVELDIALASYAGGLRLDEEAAKRERDRVRMRVQALAFAERELGRAEPERIELKTIVGDLLRDVENARIAAAGVEPSARIVDPATVPLTPVKPRIGFGLAAGLVLGILCALLWAWFNDQYELDREMSRAALSADTTLEVFGRVAVTGPTSGAPRALKMLRGDNQTAALWLPLMEDPDSQAAQMYRALRARLRYATGRGGLQPKTIGITSSSSGEGVSTLAINLAMARAQIGERILLVDANLRRPSLKRAIDASGLEGEDPFGDDTWNALGPRSRPSDKTRAAGLAECLDGTAHWSEAAAPSGFPTLDFLDAGKSAVVATDLLASRIFDVFCSETSQVYDAVIFDMAAMDVAPDAESAARSLDAMLFVESESIQDGDPHAQGAGRLLAAGGIVLGIVRTVTVERRRNASAAHVPSADAA